MNQLNTYTIANFESRIEKFINEDQDKVALIASDALFKKYNKYKCKVCKQNIHMLPLSSILHSVFTPFQKYGKGKYTPNYAFKWC